MNKNLDELSTPALMIDLDIVEKNLKKAAELARCNGKKLRPHIKTHKMPQLAQLQMAYGAVGICAAKLSEAEVMIDGGVGNVLLANQIVGADKLEHLARLAKKAQLTVLTDSRLGVDLLAETALKHGIELDVLVEVETGDLRCGAAPEDVIQLVQYLIQHPQLHFKGLETFGGSIYHSADQTDMSMRAMQIAEVLLKLKVQLEAMNITVQEISVGGSPSLEALAKIDGITELRPGVYIFNDVASVYRSSAAFEECAATVLTTIISKPTANRLVIDGGAKTFSYCCPGSVFGKKIYHGAILGNEEIAVTKLSEEHGIIESSLDLGHYHIGDKIRIIPTHACPVINLFDTAYFCRSGVVVEEVSIAARGKTR